MPEGDTVWRTARRLHAALAGSPLTVCDLRHPRWATVDLRGRLVTEVASRGKHLLLRTTAADAEPITVHSHLGMEGEWWLFRAGERRRRGPEHEIRAIVGTAAYVAVAYRLAELTVVPTAQEETLVGHLGPDLLGPDWDPEEAVRRLSAQPDRTIGEALLDQRNLAGIGNLYRSEVLFLRGVAPWTPVRDTPDLPAVVALAERLLAANRLRTEQATTGSLRQGSQHWVYRRAGQPCRRCRTMVRSAELGPAGEERRIYWCAMCQPGPEPATLLRPSRPS
jgi:endonuclease-8